MAGTKDETCCRAAGSVAVGFAQPQIALSLSRALSSGPSVRQSVQTECDTQRTTFVFRLASATKSVSQQSVAIRY